MITISFSNLCTFYVTFLLIGLFSFWFYSEHKNKNGKFKFESEKFFWQCLICTYTYVDSQHRDISICPRCGSYNKREGTKK